MKQSPAIAVAIGLLALGLSACGSSSSGSPRTAAVQTGGTATQLLPSDLGNLNPLTGINGDTRIVDHYAYDPLVNQLPSGRMVSGLATSWHLSGRAYTFKLRRGVTCSDGSTLSASTVAANLNFIADPKNNSPSLGVFLPAGIKAVGHDATSSLTVNLSKPAPFFLQGLTNVLIVCAKGLADPKRLTDRTDGTGPYALASSVAGQQYDFAVRHGYDWGPQGASTRTAGIPAKLVLKVVANPTTEANLLLEGQANIAAVEGVAAKPLQHAGLYHSDSLSNLGEFWFNQSSGHPGASQAVRQALTEALDLHQVGSVLSEVEGETPTGLVTASPRPCTGNTLAANLPSHDPASAARLLDRSGWRMGSGHVRTRDGKPLSLTILYDNASGTNPSSAMELAAQEWSKVGVKVKLVSDTPTALEGVAFGTSGAWDMIELPFGANLPTQMQGFVSGPLEPKGENFAHIENRSYDSLVAAAASKSGTTGCPQWNRAEAALFRAADVVPFENGRQPFWGKSVTFTQVGGAIFGTSLRLRQG